MATERSINVDGSCLRDERQPMTSYEPSVWGDTFSTSSVDQKEQQKYAEAIDALKQEARAKLMAATTPLQQMILIDTLERLALSYHFETEIEQILQQIYITAQNDDIIFQDWDLFATALGFRLLRQHGHYVSCNVFNKFANKDGKFEESLRSDYEGLLSLYEAADVQFRNEKILEEAVVFTSHYLKLAEAELESPLKEKVKRALKRPFHRDVRILYARLFIPIYEMDPSRDEIILKLAKLNFNFLQNVYKEELFQLSRWWNKFDLKTKLPYARDRVVEAYTWGVGYRYEPQYSYVRMGLAKGIQIVVITDDTYDNYATLNEAELFTQIIDKWNMDDVDRLPENMETLYRFILSTYEDYERDAAELGKGFAPSYFKETVQQFAKACNQELKWSMDKEMPSFQDYAKNAEITSCIYILFAAIIPGFKSATEETIDWMKSEPKLALSSATIGRYWNDIGSHQREESKGGKVFTVYDCYMKEYGATKQETFSKFKETMEEAWKDVNEELVVKTPSVPKEITMQFLTYARNSTACYNTNNGDGYSDPKVSNGKIAALFIDPILI